MSYYLIFTKEGSFNCFTKDKKILKKYLKERNIDKYNVLKIKDRDMTEKLKKSIEYEEIFVSYGVCMCASEEEYLFESLYTLENEAKYYIETLIRYFKYLKFSKKEEKIVESFIEKIINIINTCDDEKYNIDKYVQRIIRNFWVEE